MADQTALNYEQQLIDDIASFATDPLGYILYAFPWGEPGPLENFDGPDEWQKEILEDVGRQLQSGQISQDEALNTVVQMAVSSGHGVGKVQPKSLIIPTPDGFRRWGDLRPGDQVFGADGKPTRILQIHENGVMDIYKVTFDDGSSTLCGRDHNWTVRGRAQRRTDRPNGPSLEWLTMTTAEIIDAGVKRSNGRSFARQWEIPSHAPVEFDKRPVPLDPYILGLWIGNGDARGGRISFNDLNTESLDRLRSIGSVRVLNDVRDERSHSLVCIVYGITGALDELNLRYKGSSERFIPDIYKFNDIRIRSELLRGLMDSDGECNKRGSAIYSTTSSRLAEDILWLARSLGGKAMLHPTPKLGKYKNADGDNVECKYCCRVTLTMPRGFRLFYADRKQERMKPEVEQRYLTRWIESIENTDKTEDCMCITVANPDGLYLTNDFIVTHNSALCNMIILWAMSTMPDTRGVVTANTQTQLTTKTWAELAKWHSMCINKHWFELTATSLFSRDPGHEKTWRIDAIPWSKEKSEAFAGLHNQNRRILIIFDEASAIPPIIWEVTEGAQTDKNTEILWFAFGNPTRNDGRFHDCFYKDSKYWHHKKIDSRTAKMTNKKLIADQIERYGIDSDFIKVRVRGEFPSASVSQYISMDLIDAAKDRAKALIESDLTGVPLIFGLDVARFGDDNSVLWIRQGMYTKRKFSVNGYDTVRLANLLMQHMDQDNPAAVFIDISGGLGAGVYDILNNLGRRKIFPVNFGEKALKEIVYPNKRCEMYGELKEWLIDGGCLPYEGEEAEYISEDLMAIDYFFNNKSQITLEKKEDIKEKLGRSPDDGDALALTFAMPVPPQDIVTANRTVRTTDEYRPLQMRSRQNYKPLGRKR